MIWPCHPGHKLFPLPLLPTVNSSDGQAPRGQEPNTVQQNSEDKEPQEIDS